MPEDTSVFLFGSQANLKEVKKADFDIGILSKERLDYKALFDFQDALEGLPVLYYFDVVDFNAVEDSFKKVALRNIEFIIDDRPSFDKGKKQHP